MTLGLGGRRGLFDWTDEILILIRFFLQASLPFLTDTSKPGNSDIQAVQVL